MRDVLEVVFAFERGNWEECSRLAKKMSLSEEKLCDLHLQAIRWSHELTRAHEEESAEVKV